jgi:uncharacterized protein
MTEPVTPIFRLLAIVTLVGVPLYGWRVRGWQYATFAFIVLALSLPGAVITHARIMGLLPPAARWVFDAAFAYSMAAAGAHLAALVTPRLHPRAFRLAVSIPGMTFAAAGALSGLWLLALLPLREMFMLVGWDRVLAFMRPLDVLPLLTTAFSVITSVRPRWEVVRIELGKDGPFDVSRLPVERYRRRQPRRLDYRPLRIVQIADPHLGPWQPPGKLRHRIERLIQQEPDLVLLTGDFLTMESGGTPGSLATALAPLRTLPGRCFGILGNHDHAYPGEVRAGLAAVGVRLLVDEEAIASTAFGKIQVVGADYVSRSRRDHIQNLLLRCPRRDGIPRFLLLHDPSGFRHVPKGDVDLTISGHTHGGQLGLLSLGLDWTVLSRSPWPDHGLFGHGPNRLYVHRGIGFYGFPLRVGVPGEASVLEILGIDPVGAAARTLQ